MKSEDKSRNKFPELMYQTEIPNLQKTVIETEISSLDQKVNN